MPLYDDTLTVTAILPVSSLQYQLDYNVPCSPFDTFFFVIQAEPYIYIGNIPGDNFELNPAQTGPPNCVTHCQCHWHSVACHTMLNHSKKIVTGASLRPGRTNTVNTVEASHSLSLSHDSQTQSHTQSVWHCVTVMTVLLCLWEWHWQWVSLSQWVWLCLRVVTHSRFTHQL